MQFTLLSDALLPYRQALTEAPDAALQRLGSQDTPVDYFQFYNSVASVYSSKIEGEDIDFDSFFKHKFMGIEYLPDYTKKANDLFRAYEFILSNKLTFDNLLKVHAIISTNLLPQSHRGRVRGNPMFVINSQDQIEYVAAKPASVKDELAKLFADIATLQKSALDTTEVFYFAAYLHLVFVKIHPFNDGNGRTGRLLEKWFLMEKLGNEATAVRLEKNYYQNLKLYYANLKALGIEYEALGYAKALPFLLMTVTGMQQQ